MLYSKGSAKVLVFIPITDGKLFTLYVDYIVLHLFLYNVKAFIIYLFIKINLINSLM